MSAWVTPCMGPFDAGSATALTVQPASGKSLSRSTTAGAEETSRMPAALATPLPAVTVASRACLALSMRSLRIQFDNVIGWMSKSAAIASRVTPSGRFLATSTTSSRNSFG